MNTNRDFKMMLLDKFGIVDEPKTIDFCREAYKFLTEDEAQAQTPAAPAPVFSDKTIPDDGIYLIYSDNSYCKYNEDCKKEDAKYIGVIHEGHAFAITLKDLGRFQLLKDEAECEDDSEFYLPRECDALNDWECEKRTKRIQELGTDIPLADGEFIPALPMLVAMCYWRNKGLDEALKAVGGEPFSDSYYWSVTEYSSSSAWLVNFSNGGVYNGYKYYGNVVRPVVAFPL